MKHVSLFKSLSLSLGTVAAVAPVAIMATSCGAKVAIKTDFISYADMASELCLDKLESKALSKESIVLGTKKFCEGNYFLVVGSNTFESSRIYFSGNQYSILKEEWYGSLLNNSFWLKTVLKIAGNHEISNKLKPFGFVNYIDFSDMQIFAKDGHILHVTADATKYVEQTAFSPFAKLTDPLIKQTKIWNREIYKYEWDETTVSTSDYIRQDDSAKAYRELCKFGAKMFPTNDKRKTTFDASDGSTKTLVFFYKDGKLTEVFDAPTQQLETGDNKIIELVKKNLVEEEKK